MEESHQNVPADRRPHSKQVLLDDWDKELETDLIQRSPVTISVTLGTGDDAAMGNFENPPFPGMRVLHSLQTIQMLHI